MKGHIRERSPGHFAIILDIRDPETGKRRRKWHSFRGTKREVQIECSRLVTEFVQGDYLEPSKTINHGSAPDRNRRAWICLKSQGLAAVRVSGRVIAATRWAGPQI